MKREYKDTELLKKVSAAGGNYYETAHEIGMYPYRLVKRLLGMKALPEELRGRILVYQEEGQRLQNARRAQKENTVLRREVRAASDFSNLGDDILRHLNRKDWPKRTLKEESKAILHHPDQRWTEWLFSDLHYGKVCDGFNPKVAELRVEQYADAIKLAHKTIRPTHTTIAFLGDLIENANKHRDSQTGSAGIGTAEQIVGAFRLCRKFLERVIPTCGKTIDIIGVTGNHENPFGGGAMMTSPGKHHYTHIIYSLLADEFKSYVKDITWHVPDGNYAYVSKTHTVYEHGDDTQPTDRSMKAQLVKRSNQLGMFATRFRQGDKHVAVSADGDKLICNGAFYSDRSGTEYSGIKGYSAEPMQVGVLPNHVVRFVRLV